MKTQYQHALSPLLIFGIALMTSQGCAIAQSQPACASIATTDTLNWNTVFSPGGTWELSLAQDAEGSITGSATYVSSACTDTPLSVAGTANGNGSFSLAITDPNGKQMCAETDFNVTLSGSGCAQTTGNYTEVGGGYGTVKMTDGSGVQAKAETTPIFFYYLANYPADAFFWQEIAPTNYNFQGRAVTETFPNGITGDSCNKPGSPIITPHPLRTVYPLVTSLDTTGGVLSGDGVMTGYGDDDGLDVSIVDAIRGVAGDTPCVITTQQNMYIDLATGGELYQQNNIAFYIGFSTYAVQRGPKIAPTRELVTPTTLKVTATVSQVTTLLLTTAHQ